MATRRAPGGQTLAVGAAGSTAGIGAGIARALAAAGFAPPAFFEAGTPLSFGSLAMRVPLVGRGIEALLGPLAASGFSLPFGSLFAIASR